LVLLKQKKERIKMKLVFTVREKIYDEVKYTIKVPDDIDKDKLKYLKEEIEELVSDFEDWGDSDDLGMKFMEEYGMSNVQMSKNGMNNMYPADCCEFEEWIDEEEDW
jgi:hypothetical protein